MEKIIVFKIANGETFESEERAAKRERELLVEKKLYDFCNENYCYNLNSDQFTDIIIGNKNKLKRILDKL